MKSGEISHDKRMENIINIQWIYTETNEIGFNWTTITVF